MSNCYDQSDDEFFEELIKKPSTNISEDIDLFKNQMKAKGYSVTVVFEEYNPKSYGEKETNSR